MKRFITLLAVLLIGVACMAAEKADYKQSNAPPGSCIDLSFDNYQAMVINAQVDIVVDYAFEAVDAAPVAVFEISPGTVPDCGEIVKPPDLRLTNFQASLSINNYNMLMKDRAWLIYRVSLERKLNFLHPTVRSLPVPFD